MAQPDYTLLTTLNRCDNKPYYFKNTYGYGYGQVGEFFCYNEEVYEITELGGGGIINYVINNQGSCP